MTPRGLGRAPSRTAEDCFGPQSPGGGKQTPRVCVLNRCVTVRTAPGVAGHWLCSASDGAASPVAMGEGESLTAWAQRNQGAITEGRDADSGDPKERTCGEESFPQEIRLQRGLPWSPPPS